MLEPLDDMVEVSFLLIVEHELVHFLEHVYSALFYVFILISNYVALGLDFFQ